ncbi:DUF1499 domain-containing protein [Rhizobium straminoryzae]|uniref:DUF1499 domain-containing protein n=1 Tax=Rhizobium straminoryzae TaxID=1387186 RepID=A0A549TC47_9HYPH|nr:DUF1499 domain-containing protein [Rhizobium straminoryzae]TRL39424.1 DUF1499 domain-containing protein [Rhizobium straminoryzae]
MTVRFVRPVSRAAHAGKRLAEGGLVLFVLAILAHRFGPLSTPHLVALLLAAGALAALSVPLALRGLVQLWQVGALGGIASLKALICALPPLALVAYGLFLYQSLPRLYDVTTDPDDPPAWKMPVEAAQIWLPRSFVVSSADRDRQRLAYPALTGRRYEGALDRVYEAVIKVGKENRIHFQNTRRMAARGAAPPAVEKALPATGSANRPVPDVIPVPLPRPSLIEPSPVPVADNGDLLLQGDTRTLILGLPFDLVVRLREEEETTLVDMRVASRFGPHDLGQGAEIAEVFLRALDAELLGIAAE